MTDGGSIINSSSIMAYEPVDGSVGYIASKAVGFIAGQTFIAASGMLGLAGGSRLTSPRIVRAPPRRSG
jgi:hypothetical protein